MNLMAQTRPMTLAEFLAWEEHQDLRYEFDGIRPVAMVGGTEAHAGLLRNLAISIGGRLRGKPCRFYGSELKVVTGGRARYPDGFVTCAPFDGSRIQAVDPVVVFEVLSKSTALRDRTEKNAEYQGVPSILRYVMIEQDRVFATVFERRDDDWIGHLLKAGDWLRMPEIDVELPLAELYEGIELVRKSPAINADEAE